MALEERQKWLCNGIALNWRRDTDNIAVSWVWNYGKGCTNLAENLLVN